MPEDLPMRRPSEPAAGVDALTHALEIELAGWLREAPIEDVLRCLVRRAWHPAGNVTRPYRLRPEILAAVRRRVAVLIHERGGSYQDKGCVIRSDGEKIWTELG